MQLTPSGLPVARLGAFGALDDKLELGSVDLLLTLERSTINHSNTDEELAFAIKIIKPKIIIVDAIVKTKLDKALKIINGRPQETLVMTLLSRCQGHALVCHSPVLRETILLNLHCSFRMTSFGVT